ncbi:hypothetical protein CK203_038488 [Vitis vinifera]|uniref:Uncharacterized protein n=1 Tax=Vitis vinifera TaxID=29760 RepID=A0A438IRZ4_VITVI|nr:hypothetical protein CK203_038488 [Vitis vinifera]
MIETSRDWSEKLPFALWAYRISFRTSIGATPYSLVYGMEAVLPVEIKMGSLRVALEQQIPEVDWAQARLDQLNLLDERRFRAANHVCAYQGKMTRAFKKRVKPRLLQKGDLVLKVIKGLIRDPRGKFKPNWSEPYFIRELTLEGATWLMDLNGNLLFEPTNMDQQKSFLSILLPYHPSLRYVPCLKTTLRPWDQMSSSTAHTWTVEPFLSHSVRLMLFDIVMILGRSYPRCIDSHIIISVEYMSDLLCIHGAILELSGQTGYTSCYTGAYFPLLAMEMIVSSQIYYGFHYSAEGSFLSPKQSEIEESSLESMTKDVRTGRPDTPSEGSGTWAMAGGSPDRGARHMSSWGIRMELLRIAMCAPCHQGEGSLRLAPADGPPCDIPPGCLTSEILLRRHSIWIFHIRHLTPDGRGGLFNFPGQTYPDPLIVLTRRVSQPFCTMPRCSPEASRYLRPTF